ncbi:ATP-dependent Clp protease proteolytic subunit [Micromonospora sp. DR5-3]|uniref:ATP-dependent Clp protease proteolytic subunit n=1 Tax=unclassified Micromonospora TaxID=2617518 RepID=UPI0011D4F350|nr:MULTISPECIES: ATP-dependent Clp protease proteolytic subunit [unclassified Micromonospora]MCW3816218.1 ATP-dependent Clp protease proteolytic subunit [Micromonospora sp. DR5-3]TYC23964.1 ATP-dependent Clp protease proteolytic subunit [Micromonospora sp. MP36]
MGYGIWMLDEGQPSFGDRVFERLLKERIIFLGTEVTDASANQISAQILLLAAEDPERDIFLYINSPGGSVSAGMAVYDTMQYVKNDVATLALGMAGSMGQFLLCAGAAGKRFALPHSRIMMHQPSGGFGGTVADITIQAENMLHVKRTMQELIGRHSGRTLAEIQRDWDRDRWFTAEEAREYGLIDQVVSSAEQLTA